jgi:CubicO group peptidase (beta-lactamase class C family)
MYEGEPMSEYTRREVVRHSVAAAALAFLPVVAGVSRRGGRKQVNNAEAGQALTWSLDVNGFFASMKAGLGGTSGYSMELRRHGVTVGSYSAGNAINGPAESTTGNPVSSVPWTTTTNMQIASCSKLITAIALTKLLAQTGVSPDDPISPYLPGYWAPGPDVELITFANLMTQTSGLTDLSGGQDYAAARQAIEAGVADASKIGAPGQLSEATWDYQNINFDLCRILMATISGTVDAGYLDHGLLHPQVTVIDKAWDALTLKFYQQYVQEAVLGPAGVSATLTRPADCALAYTNPPVTAPGWNSGDMTEYAGPTGWHLSVDAMLTLMGAFRRAGTILSPAAAQAMLDARYAIDWGDNGIPQSCRAGLLYPKNGSQSNGTQEEQTSVVFLPLDMEFAVWVNSPASGFLLGTACTAFVDNIGYLRAPANPRLLGNGRR